MAHECPTCGLQCHCGGDIDDMVLPSRKHESRCDCCVCPDCKEDLQDCECGCDQCGEPFTFCFCPGSANYENEKNWTGLP